MKRNTVTFFLVFAALVAFAVWASEPVVCRVAVNTVTSHNTAAPDAGSCSWGKGAVVLMECGVPVFMSTTGIAGAAPVASSGDQFLDFATNHDPYLVYLNENDLSIGVLATPDSGVPDGGAVGECKFMTTRRKKPF